jgi:hypothetical protein
MEATGLVDVSRPFWCSRQCRVTVPARMTPSRVRSHTSSRAVPHSNIDPGQGIEDGILQSKQGLRQREYSASAGLTVGCLRLHDVAAGRGQHAGHEAQGAVALRHDVRLHIPVVVPAGVPRRGSAAARGDAGPDTQRLAVDNENSVRHHQSHSPCTPQWLRTCRPR